MPDWFYRTVAQPALFRMSDRNARALALGLLGQLGKWSVGRAVIDFMGHMRADRSLRTKLGATEIDSPMGIGWRVDPECRATAALARFGVGVVEVREDGGREVVRAGNRCLSEGRARMVGTHSENDGVVRLKRREHEAGIEAVILPDGEKVPVVPWDTEPSADLGVFLHGVFLQYGEEQAGGGWSVPATGSDALVVRVRQWRRVLGPDRPIIVSGGVAQPSDARALRLAGATLILVDAGLVFHGPGLIKRCNAALVPERSAAMETAPTPGLARHAWFWATALGAALALGGALTLGLAMTRVLLPYDEHYLGISAELLARTQAKLFAFMAHDRGTLAGTMLGLGWLYVVLAMGGIRRGVHGVRMAVVASAVTGFATFFSFLGFGYFDALHAFVAVVLFQLTVQIMVSAESIERGPLPLSDDEDAAWIAAQWGQLLWLVHAVGLILAGAVILRIGMTSVFVAEDLDFLCLTAKDAAVMNERLIGVVAHDRATLGGMLLASGVGALLPVLWCYQRGATWLWWAMAGLGVPAYSAALGVHLWVGYTDWRHLLPAVIGLALWLAGLLLSRRYLTAQK